MASELDWMEANGRRWDFSASASSQEESPAADADVGYEAALPGLQALYADASEARQLTAGPSER